MSDPLFHKDISFYIFSLPFLTHVYSWLMFTIIFTIVATGFIYLTRRSFRFIPPRTWQVAPQARMHLAILAAALFFWGTFGVWLELNDLLFTKRGVVFGPGYTEVTTQLWVLKTLMVVCILCALSAIYYAFSPNWRVPAVAVAVFLLLMIVGRG
ncbi:MAG: UPF0182 family protein, partial [Syntrophales bacterium LBB04]|nr:UPF0182 family protein [Syntrophales bacterium LBB04]